VTAIDALGFLASFAAGGLVGLVVFGGLWLTLRDLDRARHPAVRVLGSLLLRLGVVLGLFYLLIDYGGWQHALAAALGFTLMRVFVIRRVKLQAIDKGLDA
jgi:F1F0 ATPase subunit 2